MAGQFDGNVTVNGNFTVNGGSNLTIADGAITPSKLADGAVTLTKIADGAVESNKIASGQVVKGLNGLTDNVSLTAGANVTITPSGNTLTISAASVPGGSPAFNPLQVATQRWFEVNEAVSDISVGNVPLGMAFDGNNIWWSTVVILTALDPFQRYAPVMA